MVGGVEKDILYNSSVSVYGLAGFVMDEWKVDFKI